MRPLVAPLLASLALAALGCEPGGSPLVVSARSDLEPGVDFVATHAVVLTAEAGTLLGEREASAEAASYLEGQPVLELEALPPGAYRVRVALLTSSGVEAVARSALVDVDTATLVTVLLSASCAGVSCPGPGQPPELSACHGGRCTTERCSPETPEACPPPECATDGDCGETAGCGAMRCVSAICWFDAAGAECDAGETCRPDVGCAVCDAGGACVPTDPCAGVECAPGSFCADGSCGPCAETESACGDGVDEDCDGAPDCDDPDCDARLCDAASLCSAGVCTPCEGSCATWDRGDWSSCRGGRRTRTVRCAYPDGTDAPEAECPGDRPSESESCCDDRAGSACSQLQPVGTYDVGAGNPCGNFCVDPGQTLVLCEDQGGGIWRVQCRIEGTWECNGQCTNP